jgi:hypothetical protein
VRVGLVGRLTPAAVGTVAITAALLAGCSSSGPAGTSSSVPAPVTTSAPSTPASAPASTSASPSPSSSPPLSRFEADPGVQVLRAWARTAARTINDGHYTSAALRALLTPAVAAEMKQTLGTEVGLYYPGPAPFTPVRVSVTSPSARKIDVCLVSDGFSQNKTTHKPAKRLRVVPVTTRETLTGGHWRISELLLTTAFSCSGVKVPMPSW